MSICFSCWLRCLRCAKRCSLLRGCLLRSARRWILIGVLQRSFNGKSSSARICWHLLCLQFYVISMGNCSWFTNGKHCFPDGQVYVAWKHKMLIDVIGRHQGRYIYLWRIEFCRWLRPCAVSRLRARRDYKVSTLGNYIKLLAHRIKMGLFIQQKSSGR